jgi:signal transduction histidine kinase
MKKLTDEEILDEMKRRFIENQRNISDLKILNEQLMNVNLKLVESEKLKSHFLSNIRNEIINPLSSILSLSQSIATCESATPKTICDQAKFISDEAFNLNLQLNNIFASAEIEAGELLHEFYNVDIAGLIETELHRFKDFSAKRHLALDFENHLPAQDQAFTFRTNPEKIKMIISNLLVNAVCWSQGEQNVIIRAKTSQNNLVIEVQDFGVGIAPGDIPQIFDRFKQLDPNIYTENRGNGLGLAIVKAYIEFLEGTIEVKSEIKKGSTFIVTLPQPPEGLETEGFSTGGQEFLFGESEIF